MRRIAIELTTADPIVKLPNMAEVPTPGSDAPTGAMLVLPGDGREVFRLRVTGPDDEISKGDFQPRYGPGTAREMKIPELLRQGLSHYLTLDDAQAVNRKGSAVARVTLEPSRFHFARTGEEEGHIDVWGRPQDFVELAQPLE